MKDNLARKPNIVVVKPNRRNSFNVALIAPTTTGAPPLKDRNKSEHFSNNFDNQAPRWLSSLLIALAIHATPVVWWLIPSSNQGTSAPPPAAMVVELAPAPVAPQAKLDMPPGPEQTETAAPQKIEPIPEPEPEIPPPPPAVKPEVAMNQKPEPEDKPLPKQEQPVLDEPEDAPPEEEPTSISSAPPEAPLEDEIAAAPHQGVSTAAVNSNAIPDWQSTLMLKLNEVKRYPSLARRYRQEGITYLRFTMDREGNVLAKSIEQQSGYPMLDEETLALIDRAQPLPQPPIQMAGETLEFVVPVEFFLKR